MGHDRSPDGRFEIICHTRDDDSYFYSDRDYEWYVRSLETGDELASFSGHWYQCRGGDARDGVKVVSFSPEGDAAMAKRFDGTSERVELPARVAIVDGGRAIELAWRDGRTERRERRRVSMTSKYGQPFGPPLLGEPEPPPKAAARASPKPAARAKKGVRKPVARKAAAKRRRRGS